jgi:hypothetical protein
MVRMTLWTYTTLTDSAVPNPATLRPLSVGDTLVFYCSGRYGSRSDSGYWGTGKVTTGLFVSHERLWPDDVYPARVRFEPHSALLRFPVPVSMVREALGGRKLAHLRQTSVIALDSHEYEAIQPLIKAAAEGIGKFQ